MEGQVDQIRSSVTLSIIAVLTVFVVESKVSLIKFTAILTLVLRRILLPTHPLVILSFVLPFRFGVLLVDPLVFGVLLEERELRLILEMLSPTSVSSELVDDLSS